MEEALVPQQPERKEQNLINATNLASQSITKTRTGRSNGSNSHTEMANTMLVFEGHSSPNRLSSSAETTTKLACSAEPARSSSSSTQEITSISLPLVWQGLQSLGISKQASDVILLALLTGQRHQTLHCLRLDGLTLETKKCVFCITEVLKHTRPGYHQKPIELLAFEPDHRLCVIWHLKEYLDRTKELRYGEQRLLLSFQRPHKAASKETIARWTKVTLTASGLDMNMFAPHSTRAASTSAVKSKGTQLQVILDSAGWSGCKTFAQFYNKPILKPPNFGAVLLQNS